MLAAPGSVLKMRYAAPAATAASAIRFAVATSASTASGPNVGVVMMKTVCAPCIAASSDARSPASAADTSTPRARSSAAMAELVARVSARSWYVLESSASSRTLLRTELPCWPVAPKTARILDMMEDDEALRGGVFVIGGRGGREECGDAEGKRGRCLFRRGKHFPQSGACSVSDSYTAILLPFGMTNARSLCGFLRGAATCRSCIPSSLHF